MIRINTNSRNTVSDPQILIEKSLSHPGEYLVEIEGKKLWAHPEVLSQEYSYSSAFVIKNWDIEPGMSVLDIGTGNGVLAIFSALKGASRIVATDINPFSCPITQKNVELLKLENLIECFTADIFDGLKKEKFDRVIFNAPYWNKKPDPQHPITYALYDENYAALERFLSGVKECVSKNGKVLLAFSKQGDVEHVNELIRKQRLKIEKLIEETKGHTRLLYFLKPLI